MVSGCCLQAPGAEDAGSTIPIGEAIALCANATDFNPEHPVVVRTKPPARHDDAKPKHRSATTSRRISLNLVPPIGVSLDATANVTLSPIDSKAPVVELTRRVHYATPDADLRFDGEVPAGIYILTASSNGLVATPRQLAIDTDLVDFSVHLGRPNSPFFRMGTALVPFTPRSDLIALSFVHGPPGISELAQIATDITQRTQAQPFVARKTSRHPLADSIRAKGSVLLFSLPPGGNREVIIPEIRSLIKAPVRVGTPIDLTQEHLRILDNRFYLHFASPPSADTRKALETELEVSVVSVDPYDPTLWLVDLKSHEFEKNLAMTNCLVEHGALLTGEPDLLVPLIPLGLPEDWPNDPRYQQFQKIGNHSAQGIRKAWELLADPNITSPTAISDPSVVIGILDLGIDPTSPEVKCPVANAVQVSKCFDAQAAIDCSDPNYSPPGPLESHGMGIFGVIAACTNNMNGVSGIAPGSRQLVVKVNAPITAFSYLAETLRWMGGLEVPCPEQNPNNPQDPLRNDPKHPCHWDVAQPPAAIINGSYGYPLVPNVAPLELSIGLSTAFEVLATQARDQKGVILVYAAGNDGRKNVESAQPLAADPRTLAIANCMIGTAAAPCADAQTNVCLDPGVPNKYAASNVGHRIDICALGRNSQTIPPWCENGQCVIGGTSAAAATVSGVLGLVLTANPTLTLEEVRELLRSTARPIDQTGGQWSNGRSPVYGSGLLDACHAVKKAVELRVAPDPSPWPTDDPCS